MREWRITTLRNGMVVQYAQNTFGTDIVYGRFWLHIRELDWSYVESTLEKEFPQAKKREPDVVVVTEPDGCGAMIGTLVV